MTSDSDDQTPSSLFDVFNPSNSIVTNNNEIEVIANIDCQGILVEVNKPCKIFSRSQKVINCKKIGVTSENVSIEGLEFQCAVIVSSADNFKMSNCKIRDSSGPAGLVIDSSKGVYLTNIVIDHEKGVPGLVAESQSIVFAEKLEIHGIPETLFVVNHSDVYMNDSNLYDSKANGMYVSKDAYVEVTNCTIRNTEYPAIFVQSSKAKLVENTISKIPQNAISINSSSAVVSRNTISDVSGSGIALLESSTGEVHRNHISQMGGNGIYVSGKSKVRVYKNVIQDNTYPGIAILQSCIGSLYKNTISKITYSGICVRGAEKVKIKECNIFDINECGISISDTELCNVSHNTITKCKIAAIEVYNESKANIFRNNMENIDKYGICVYTKAVVKCFENHALNINNALANLLYKGSGHFFNNQCVNIPKQKDGQTVCNYLFHGNDGFPGITNVQKFVKPDIQFEEPFVDTQTSLCIKCHKNPRNCFLLQCVHLVYCSECAQKAFENKECCPLCRFTITGVTRGFNISSDNMCVICTENPADSMIIPCGHTGLCHKCLERWYSSNKSCPICRIEQSYHKIILEDI